VSCTPCCWDAPVCAVCGRRKKPRGRSAPIEMSMCDQDCPSYYDEPRSGHHWPGEECDIFCTGDGAKSAAAEKEEEGKK
jgi:hypothetical protein